MLVVAVLVLLFAAVWRLTPAALIWAPILFCAVAAMHCTTSLHLADPLAPLYAFITSAFVGRFAWALVAELLRPRAA